MKIIFYILVVIFTFNVRGIRHPLTRLSLKNAMDCYKCFNLKDRKACTQRTVGCTNSGAQYRALRSKLNFVGIHGKRRDFPRVYRSKRPSRLSYNSLSRPSTRKPSFYCNGFSLLYMGKGVNQKCQLHIGNDVQVRAAGLAALLADEVKGIVGSNGQADKIVVNVIRNYSKNKDYEEGSFENSLRKHSSSGNHPSLHRRPKKHPSRHRRAKKPASRQSDFATTTTRTSSPYLQTAAKILFNSKVNDRQKIITKALGKLTGSDSEYDDSSFHGNRTKYSVKRNGKTSDGFYKVVVIVPYSKAFLREIL